MILFDHVLGDGAAFLSELAFSYSNQEESFEESVRKLNHPEARDMEMMIRKV